ncbi:MAG: hydantoinase/carbamoylase family amidase [Betaproteobacteria bacterium]|nr:hydantoinase/carbamoylase family amidase [Betaproteobacteria bacterium]
MTSGRSPTHAVSEQRLWDRHMTLARHGATSRGGVNRQALSAEDIEARRTMIGWARGIGCSAFGDALGNFFIRLEGSRPELAPVLTGSHLDSQPTGGKFDGVYGVLAGFEVLQAIRDSGLVPVRSVEVVSWMNEEGSRFAPGMMGSAGFAGARTLTEILSVRDAGQQSVAEALAELARALPDLPSRPLRTPVHSYIEAHIEQAPVLEARRLPIGIVTGIQGKRTFRATVTGEESHAGTTPHRRRRDALLSATGMVQALEKLCFDPQDITRFTVGMFRVEPNAPSVIPAKVVFSIDIRHESSQRLIELGDAVLPLCSAHAGPCDVRVEELSTAMSLEFPESIRSDIEKAAARLGLGHMRLLSAAGHDARYLNDHCETGMIFIPCLKGVSHHESESATAADLAAGARVLAEVVWARANDLP